MAAEERPTETERRIRAAMAQLLGGDIPEGLKCDIKSLMRPAGVSSGRLWPAAAGGSALVEPGLVRDLRRDRAPAGSPVTGLLMGCRAPFGVST